CIGGGRSQKKGGLADCVVMTAALRCQALARNAFLHAGAFIPPLLAHRYQPSATVRRALLRSDNIDNNSRAWWTKKFLAHVTCTGNLALSADLHYTGRRSAIAKSF